MFRSAWLPGAALPSARFRGVAFRSAWFRDAVPRSAEPRPVGSPTVGFRIAARRFVPRARGARRGRTARCVRRRHRTPRRRAGLPATKRSVRCGRPRPPASSGAPRRRCRRPLGRRRCRACRSPRAGAPRCPTRSRRPTRRPAGRAPCVPSSPSMPELRAWPGDSIRRHLAARGEHGRRGPCGGRAVRRVLPRRRIGGKYQSTEISVVFLAHVAAKTLVTQHTSPGERRRDGRGAPERGVKGAGERRKLGALLIYGVGRETVRCWAGE
ncbi:hypothetical protein [Nocardia amikacinitolerans]|uniref:hypothetical protein n=1 Tax=Nocardia amikacinitolerans TaxID=756689 RepID=UPI003557C6E2